MRRRHRFLITIVVYIICLSPILYGLNLYAWDPIEFFRPRYTPPSMDFDIDVLEYRFIQDKLAIVIEIANIGDIDIIITDSNLSLYSSDWLWIADLEPDLPVNLPSGESRNMTIYMALDRDVLVRAVKYIISTDRYMFWVNGTIVAVVYSSKAYVPFKMALQPPSDALVLLEPRLDIEIFSVNPAEDGLYIYVNVSNPTLVDWVVERADLRLVHSNGSVIGGLSLIEAVTVEAGGYEIATLFLSYDEVGPISLIRLLVGGDLWIRGSITVRFGPASVDVDVDIPLGMLR